MIPTFNLVKRLAGALSAAMLLGACALPLSLTLPLSAVDAAEPAKFEIGKEAFLLNGKPLVVRCGEIHLARVPREYWQDRLRRCRAMGMNTVCAYLFWNFHEWEPGKFDWTGQRDVAEFCRLAQAEGLYVILRPGPYACAEWEMGGLPWWLLKKDGIRLRSLDPDFMDASRKWLREVGRVLGSQQVTKGGPILMVQVENEYGFYGDNKEYMLAIRQAAIDAGFDVPLFACNPRSHIKVCYLPELFAVVNFGSHPQGGFEDLRKVQPAGPLMCGEYYPGWFDTWGAPHHRGGSDGYIKDLKYMLENKASFSIYMAHGGSSFGMWSGADRPFKPDTSSYDYDAPISEAGWLGDKFTRTRELMSQFLDEDEKLPEPPANLPVMTVPEFRLTETAPLLAPENLPAAVQDDKPRNMEKYDQGRGCIVYRTTLPAGPEVTFNAKAVNDFGWIFVDGKPVAEPDAQGVMRPVVMDRRKHLYKVKIPARDKPAVVDILVEAMGRINFGQEVHDRKGLIGPVSFRNTNGTEVIPAAEKWQVFKLDLSDSMLATLKWKQADAGAAPSAMASTPSPAFWRGTFQAARAEDTFLDVRTWGKGVLWINGHCLGRFWNIGPTQTMYVPGPWLKAGSNEVIVLDLSGPEKPVLAGLATPVLDKVRSEMDFNQKPQRVKVALKFENPPSFSGAFPNSDSSQTVKFPKPFEGRQFCLEMLSAQDGKPFAAIAELDLVDEAGKSLSHAQWSIAYVDSEETNGEDGSATNAINGQSSDLWHSEWSRQKPGYPHHLIIDLGANAKIGGFRYTPRSGMEYSGRIKDYNVYIGDKLAPAVPAAAKP